VGHVSSGRIPSDFALLPEVVTSSADADSFFFLLRREDIAAFLSKLSRLACIDAAIESIAEK
jgi:hypothetical protein